MKENLKELIEGVYRNDVLFDEFYKKAKSLELESLETDFGSRLQRFRLKSGESFSHPFPKDWAFDVAGELNQDGLLKAIHAIDEQVISAKDFYSQAAESGVSVAFVYMGKNRILYLGRDGDFHVEDW